MAPIRKGDGTGLTPKGFSEVRKGDGTVLYSAGPAIPDSEANQKLIHRWYLGESDPFADQIGTADGTNVGTTEVVGDWVDGAAREGDGNDDYLDLAWQPSASWLGDDKALAFSVQTTDDSAFIGGVYDGSQSMAVELGDIFGNAWSNGALAAILIDGSGNTILVYTDNTYNDGNPHRAVIDMPTLDGSNWQWYVDGSAVSTSVSKNEGPSNFSDTGINWYQFDRNSEGGPDGTPVAGIQDDPCVFDNSLTESEATSYDPPWQ